MEESVKGQTDLFADIRDHFDVKEKDLRTYSPLTLAFVGDGIYDLVIRSLIVGRGSSKPSQFHRYTSHLVRAEAQAEMIEGMLPALTEEEADFYRRGKNAKPQTQAKNASAEEYHKATGFETLMGYLYLTGQSARMLDLIGIGLKEIKAPEAGEEE